LVAAAKIFVAEKKIFLVPNFVAVKKAFFFRAAVSYLLTILRVCFPTCKSKSAQRF